MSEHKLDQIVKGAPPSNVSAPQVAAAAIAREASPERAAELQESKKPSTYVPPSDPLSTLPSSPPQIYLNLLILEASLRSQYLALHARRRQHIFFLTLLAVWNVYFFYALFFRPREDGKGVGGSPYWVVDMTEKVAFMGGVLTAILIWGTGQWERGVRWPRRWLGITNRGLRGMNLKIVVIRGPWWKQLISYLSLLFPYSSFSKSQGSNYRYVDFRDKKEAMNAKTSYRDNQYQAAKEEDIAPGGDKVKLLLLPKSFSPDFRENWELYRTEYWEKENERRAELRKRVKKRDRELAKQQGGSWWWLGWRGRKDQKDIEKTHHHTHPQHRQVKETRKRRPSNQGSHSRSSSRSSSTYSATPELEDLRITDSTSLGPRKARSSTRQSTRRTTGRSTRMTPLDAANEPDEETTSTKRLSMTSNASSSASDGEVFERPSLSAKRGSSDLASNVRTRQRDLDSGEVDE